MINSRNIRELRYLVAVADEQSFLHAAERCCVSQPALSMQIKKLEGSLGVIIFERNCRSIKCTPIGSRLVAKARTILTELDQLYDIARHADRPLAEEIRLGAFPTMAPYIIPKVLSFLNDLYPEVTFSVVEDKTVALLRKLQNGELDLAFSMPSSAYPAIVTHQILSEPFYLCAANSNPICNKQSISYTDLHDQTILLLDEGHSLQEQVLKIRTHSNLNCETRYTTVSLQTLCSMVARDMGITLVPEMAIDPGNDKLSYRRFADENLQRDIVLCWPQHAARRERYRQMADAIAAFLNTPPTTGGAADNNTSRQDITCLPGTMTGTID